MSLALHLFLLVHSGDEDRLLCSSDHRNTDVRLTRKVDSANSRTELEGMIGRF